MNDDQLLRYSRQIMLPEIDIAGQESLLNTRVLIVGLGGLGCPVALYLAAAGVGHLILADFDNVDLSNLQRQIAHTMMDIDKPKTESVKQSINAMNSDVNVECLQRKLDAKSLSRAVAAADIVVDCSDNFATRFAVNRYCCTNRVPLVSGAAIRWEGQVIAFDFRHSCSPCYQCLYAGGEDENLSCSESGVLAPLVGVIGSIQAIEVIKLITQAGTALVNRLQILDAKTMEWRQLNLRQSTDCPVCGS